MIVFPRWLEITFVPALGWAASKQGILTRRSREQARRCTEKKVFLGASRLHPIIYRAKRQDRFSAALPASSLLPRVEDLLAIASAAPKRRIDQNSLSGARALTFCFRLSRLRVGLKAAKWARRGELILPNQMLRCRVARAIVRPTHHNLCAALPGASSALSSAKTA